MADAAPPSGHVRTETQGPLLTAVAIASLLISVVFVSLRFITRGLLLKAIGKDDWASLVSVILVVACSIATCVEVKYGMGRHIENIAPEEIAPQLNCFLIAIFCHTQGLNWIKLGFLFQYQRIFPQTRYIQTVCFWFIIFVLLWAVTQIFLCIFMCFPYSVINPSMVGRCLDTFQIWYLMGTMSMVTDFAIFCIPLPAVRKLQLRRRQKVMVLGIFCLGFFVCIISVYRLFPLYDGVYSKDPTWDVVGGAIWSIIEITAAVIASCLPTLRPLFARLLPGIGLTSASHDYKQNRSIRSTYLRQGSTSGGGGSHGTNTRRSAVIVSNAVRNRVGNGTDNNSEELALQDIRTGSIRTDVDAEEMDLGTGRGVGMPSGIYANASSNHQFANHFGSHEQQHIGGGITMTTEITVNSKRQ